MKPIPFPQLLHAFFHDWLVQQRNVSHHTVLSYRDSWRLFLRFVAARKAKPVAQLRLNDLTAVEVLAFLQHSEQERKVSIGTRNCRLAALHSFFSFVAQQEPLALSHCAEVLRIPTKQAPEPVISDLNEDEIAAILAQPDRSRIEGQRDQALLVFLYNTGARIQEALALSARPPLRITLTSSIVWQATKRAHLPGVARDGRVAEGSFDKTAPGRKRAHFCEPLQTSP
jgi:site-specific recombinase XerD